MRRGKLSKLGCTLAAVRHSHLFSLGALVLCAACSATKPETSSKSPATAEKSAPERSAEVLSGSCLGRPSSSLKYEVSCDEPSDCRIGWLSLDCCGSARAVGVAAKAEGRFKRSVAACSDVPSCECLAEPTVLDSGEKTEQPADIALACRKGRCFTHLRPGLAKGASWAERRDEILASYRRVVPPSQNEFEDAERRALLAPSGGPLDAEVESALDEKRVSGELLVAWCREQLNYSQDKPLESCHLRSLGAGVVLLLTLVTECGGDSCSTEGYVAHAAANGFVSVPDDVGGGAEVSPQGDALFVTEIADVVLPAPEGVEPRDPWGGEEPLYLARIALPSMEKQPFARCFSPTLSPGGAWILCRDLAGNVLKVSPAGGEPILVASSGLARGEVDFVWYAYIWPDAVEFLGDDRLKFRVVRADGESFEREVAWKE